MTARRPGSAWPAMGQVSGTAGSPAADRPRTERRRPRWSRTMVMSATPTPHRFEVSLCTLHPVSCRSGSDYCLRRSAIWCVMPE